MPSFTRGDLSVLRSNILNIVLLGVAALAGLLLVVLVGLLALQMLLFGGGCSDEARAILEEFPHYGERRIEPYPGEVTCNVRYPTAASREEILGYYDEQLRENGWEVGPPRDLEVHGENQSDISGTPELASGGLGAQRDGYRYGVTYFPPGTGDPGGETPAGEEVSAEDAEVVVEVTDEPGGDF
jgi:hypothetical protein